MIGSDDDQDDCDFDDLFVDPDDATCETCGNRGTIVIVADRGDGGTIEVDCPDC